MTDILMFPTMRCNLKCAYCHFRVDKDAEGYMWKGYDTAHYIDHEVSWEKYIEALEKFRPYHLEFSGGEPTIYRGFKELVNNLPTDCTWAITSNSLANLEGIDFSKCQFWTASWHIESEKFDRNLLYLKSKVRMAVSFVVPFKKVSETIMRTKKYALSGIGVNLLRELNPGVSWTGTEEWDELLEMRSYGYNVVEADIPESYEFERGFICKGGNSYMAIMPDGKIYRCYSDAMDGEPIGDIDNIELFDVPRDCYRECYGCAMDHFAHIKKLEKAGVA